MKYCTHCGNELNEDAVICPKCGCPTDMYYGKSGAPVSNKDRSGNPQQRLTPLTIVGFVFSFLIPLVGLICSVVAFKSSAVEDNKKSKLFAKSGIIISAVFLALQIVLRVLYYTLEWQYIFPGTFWSIFI